MDLIQFAENTSSIPLTVSQKQFLAQYEKERNDGKTLFVIFPRIQGRGIFQKIIKQWEQGKGNNL